MTSTQEQLLALLRDKQWYSVGPDLLCQKLGISHIQLEREIEALRRSGVKVNVFVSDWSRGGSITRPTNVPETTTLKP